MQTVELPEQNRRGRTRTYLSAASRRIPDASRRGRSGRRSSRSSRLRKFAEPSAETLDAWRDADREQLALVGGVVLIDRPEWDLLPPEDTVELLELLCGSGEDNRVACLGWGTKRSALARGVNRLGEGETEGKILPDDDVVLVGASITPFVELPGDLEALVFEGGNDQLGLPGVSESRR